MDMIFFDETASIEECFGAVTELHKKTSRNMIVIHENVENISYLKDYKEDIHKIVNKLNSILLDLDSNQGGN